MLSSSKNPAFLRLFAGALALTTVMSVIVCWHILDSYNDARIIQTRYVRLLDLSWTVFHRDEILTMSARMAATTQNPAVWEAQYREFAPSIDAALNEITRMELKQTGRKATSSITLAHKGLDQIEERAFQLIREGRPDLATAELSGTAYNEFQRKFLAAINALMDSTRIDMNDLLTHESRQALLVTISIAITLPLLFVSWFVVLATIKRYLRISNDAEASLRTSEEKYRELVQSASSIILQWDWDGNISFLNRFGHSFFGYDEGELYGRNLVGTIVPETDSSGTDLKILIQDILVDPTRFENNENENIRKDGSRVWVSWTNRAILDEHGKMVGILSIGNDITDRKLAEDSLKEQYRFIQLLIDTIPSPIFYKDSEGIYRGCNKAFQNYLGMPRDEIVGKSVFEVAPPDLAAKYYKMDSALMESRGSQVYETSVRYSDGTRREVIFMKAAYLGADDTVAGVVGVMIDITDRRHMEEMLRIDEARLEALYELSQMSGRSTREIIQFALDRQVDFTSSDIGFIGFMGENNSEVELQAWSAKVMDRCAVEDESFHFPVEGAGLWAEAVRTSTPIIVSNYDDPMPAKKGVPPGHVNLVRVMSVPLVEGGKVVAVVGLANKPEDYDETDVRQVTLFLDGLWKLVQRRNAEEALRQSETLAAMGRALSSVAHDIRTPLIAIGGFSRLVMNHLEAGCADRDKLSIVLKETGRLESMVKDMLDFSKPLNLVRSETNIHSMIEDSLSMMEAIAGERGVSLEARPSGSGHDVLVDSDRMKQVIVNLVMNAIQVSPEGERVIVSSINGTPNLILDVVDRGPGIPPEQREEVFSPFFTTRKEGTGLGLPIVRKIVEAHEGQVCILDNPEGGLTFRVEIPVKPGGAKLFTCIDVS